MITLEQALTDVNKEDFWEYSRILDAAPRAYRRALATYRCIETRHPFHQQVMVTPREAVVSDGFTPVNLTLYSWKGVFNMRGYELIIPALERDGMIYLDESHELSTLKTTSSHRGDEGYLYVYPIPTRAALPPLKTAMDFIAEVAAAKEGFVPAVYDEQGWRYAGKHDKSPEEVLRWYFAHNTDRFASEAATARNEPYVAFTTDPDEEGNRDTVLGYRIKMLVLGERLREASPAPWTPNREFPQRTNDLFARLNSISFGETLGMFDALRIVDDGDKLADDLRELSMSNSINYQVLKGFRCAYIQFYGYRGDRFWEDTSFQARLNLTEEGIPTAGDFFEATLAHGEDQEECIDIPDRMALGILRNCLVKMGIQHALNLGLLEPDQRGSQTVPLNEAELSYEEYLRLGVEWLKESIASAEEIPSPEEEEESSEEEEPLADWERELLEGVGK